MMRSLCDYDCVWTYKVTRRTPMTVTLEDSRGRVTVCRIQKKASEWCKAECVSPLGVYSMSPTLCADRPFNP